MGNRHLPPLYPVPLHCTAGSSLSHPLPPPALYSPTLEAACVHLVGAEVLGLDVEWKPTQGGAGGSPASILQVGGAGGVMGARMVPWQGKALGFRA